MAALKLNKCRSRESLCGDCQAGAGTLNHKSQVGTWWPKPQYWVSLQQRGFWATHHQLINHSFNACAIVPVASNPTMNNSRCGSIITIAVRMGFEKNGLLRWRVTFYSPKLGAVWYSSHWESSMTWTLRLIIDKSTLSSWKVNCFLRTMCPPQRLN